jgi:hypothetical protein
MPTPTDAEQHTATTDELKRLVKGGALVGPYVFV